MFGLFQSKAKKDRADATKTYEMVLELIGRITVAELRPRELSVASVIAESFLKELSRVTDEARARLPPHHRETPLSFSSSNYLRMEAEKAFRNAEKVASQHGFQPFTVAGTNYLLGAYILCHAWKTSNKNATDDLHDFLCMRKIMLFEEIKMFLIEAGVEENVASGLTTMH